ncbi:IS701 family transposase [Streptomyces sp. NBC_01136]|uniref:IS701 family transposase n=1 Tax=Streptomyces sp. NBC_01136 TaxID=2903754 RepID=UPI00386EAF51|nr:IS701 family transposase [Streptomyces sp. NBC_01136]
MNDLATFTVPRPPVRTLRAASAPTVDLPAYCGDLFGAFTRADQRRWGEVYVRGLLDVPGRKTPARISEQVLGHRAVQQIQQFVNQSPWASGPVRGQLARQMARAFRAEAWSVDEVVFIKNGDRSVGVARQYAASQERTVNCQLALAASLVGHAGGVPVNWRLVLPARWDRDERLRGAAHVPDEERCRPRWRYVLEAIDEMLDDWSLEPLPVLADWRCENDVDPLLRGLEARGLGYLVQVSPHTPVMLPRQCATMPGARGTMSELAAHAARHGERTSVAWHDPVTERMRQSEFLTVPVLLRSDQDRRLGSGPAPRPRLLLADWPYGRPQPRAYWLTNLPARRLAETVPLAQLRRFAEEALGRMHEEFGLGDFEGRSFRGWHHHVTLSSAALGFDMVRQQADERMLSETGV